MIRLPVAILAGGLATRLLPLSQHTPKALQEVAGEPFVVHQLRLLRAAGLTDVVLCVGYLGEIVQEALGDGSRWGVSLKYSFDGPTLLGTGGALLKALPHLGEAFLVLYGDSYLECDYQAVAGALLESGKAGLMAVFRNEAKWDRSNVLLKGGRIVRYDKAQPTPDMQHIDYGLGGLRKRAFARYDPGEPLDLARVYRDLIAGDELVAFEVAQRFYEIGSPAGLEETRQYLSQYLSMKTPPRT